LLEKYPRDVKIVLKQFPLPMHQFARKASAAVLAADRQGKYREFSHQLFENFSQLSDGKLQEIAKKLGLNLEKFNKDLNDHAIQTRINTDITDGNRANVQGTPTLFINGRLVRDRGPQMFQEIEAEARKKRQ